MILVTGCTGFIGSQLIKKLNDVLCVADKGEFSINRIDGVQNASVDLTDREKVKDLLKKAKPDLVINLASKYPASLSFDNTSFMNNAVITYNISMADAPIIHGSTAGIYPYTPYPHYYREDEAYKAPSSPYAVSKIASEMLLAGRKEKTIILRPINTIGRPISLWPAKVNRYFFETTVLAILTGKREIHYNVHPNSSRQWMFYEDNINAYLHVIKNLDRMEGVYNVSPHYSKFNHALTLGEAFSIISKELGWEGKVTWLNNPRSVDPNYLLLNSDNIYRTGFDVDDSIVAIRKAIGSLKKEVEMLKASELKAEVQHGS